MRHEYALRFMLQLCVADMYNEAAENATNAMKGRLASQYYMKAEEAAGMVEEWCHTYMPVAFANNISIVVRFMFDGEVL